MQLGCSRFSHRYAVNRLLLAALVALVACGAPHPAPRTTPTSVAQAGTGREPQLTTNDLDASTAELFGEEVKVDATLPMPSDSTLLAGGDSEPSWDIDVRSYETFDRVRHYVKVFSGPSRERIADRLSAGTRYESMIRSKLLAGGLPEDMYYLALVESGYNPHAHSRAAAVGMWQFMTTTARGMGLRVDWWVDERRDPVRSTDAAVRFLRGLNEQFGSMYLAAAAYNGGPGRIARGLNRYADDLEGSDPDEMFFTLAEKKYLRGETRNYVPQLIAVALVAKEAERYGIVIEEREPFLYDSAWVPGRVPLARIAEASGSTLPIIQELNSHFLRGMTPPTRKREDSILVRIPMGTRAQFDSAFASIPDSLLRGVHNIRTESGATWSSIARKHGVPARSLPWYNPGVRPAPRTGRIPPGTIVTVPRPDVARAALVIPDPRIERYGTSTRTHVVRSGENLSVIARRYRTTPAAIMRQNRLKKAVIFPGQELMISPGAARR
jgi:membrane-bound lytic murein transglycosylase D